MMLWNKIKIAAALVCVIAMVGTGSGWLARGRNAVEASLPAAEPPAKKEPLPQKAPDLANKIIKEMDHIHVMLAKLAERETDEEANISAKEMDARLRLIELQDELRLDEQKWDSERQQIQERQKAASTRIDRLVERMGVIDNKSEAGKKLDNELGVAKVKYEEIRRQLQGREDYYREVIRSRRKQVFMAEYELRRIENRQRQASEVRAVKRQALLARLEQLEEKSLGLEPVDRLRDVERKLDSLRREVGELRRALERQGKSDSPSH